MIKYFLQIFVIWKNGAGKKWGARYTFWYIILLTLCNGDRRIVALRIMKVYISWFEFFFVFETLLQQIVNRDDKVLWQKVKFFLGILLEISSNISNELILFQPQFFDNQGWLFTCLGDRNNSGRLWWQLLSVLCKVASRNQGEYFLAIGKNVFLQWEAEPASMVSFLPASS